MEDALLAAICARPDDISARLVYADYLLEQPEPEKRDRGEFILAQCRLSAGGLPPAEESQLRAREKNILEKYREAWLAPLARLVSNAAFHRGFPERVTLTVDQFAGGFAEVSRLTPVARLHLVLQGYPLEGVGELDALQGVVGLDLSREHVTTHGLRDLLLSPHLARLNYLNLGDNAVGNAGMDILAESPLLKRLNFLSVARNGITQAGVLRLLSRVTADAPALRYLNLRGNPLPPGKWAEVVLNWLPSKMHPALRLSLEAQLGRYRLTKPERDPGPLPRLKASATKLSPEFAAWVKALDVSHPTHLVAALRANALPAEVSAAFVSVCARRLEWFVRRELKGERVFPVPQVAGSGPKELADFVDAVIQFAWDAHKHSLSTTTNVSRWTKDGLPHVTLWLRDWLLRLFEHHAAGTLDPQGRTR